MSKTNRLIQITTPCLVFINLRQLVSLQFCLCDRFIGQQPDGILLDPDDSFWCQALEDLETCGQSELLREIEVSLHQIHFIHTPRIRLFINR